MSHKIRRHGGFFPRDRHWHPKALTPDYKSSIERAPQKALIAFDHSLSEITGPVFSETRRHPLDNDLIHNYAQPGHAAIGPRILVYGRVLDQQKKPVPNALIEIWQANAGGRYRHPKEGYIAPLDPNFGGCGRTYTDAEGDYEFRTIQPGPYPWPNGINDWRPAHIHFSIFGQGFVQRLITQMYFEGDPLIPLCPIIGTLSDGQAIDQLTAALDMNYALPMDSRAYKFDIILRGQRVMREESRNGTIA